MFIKLKRVSGAKIENASVLQLHSFKFLYIEFDTSVISIFLSPIDKDTQIHSHTFFPLMSLWFSKTCSPFP